MLKHVPFFSVLINNYNYDRFLAEAIDSVLAQDFTDYELIVVDDASTDYSSKIIASYGDKIKPILLTENQGQGGAFNAGFAASSGQYIVFLDADDTFCVNKLSEVAKSIRHHPHASIFYHQGHSVNQDYKLRGKSFPQTLPQGQLRQKVIKHSTTGIQAPTSFLIFKRELLNKILPLNPYLTRLDADACLLMLACLFGEVVAIPLALAYYRVHGDNWFSNAENQKYDLPILNKLLRRTEKHFMALNAKLTEINEANINIMNQLYYRRNLFIFRHLSWKAFISFALKKGRFQNIWEVWDYFAFGINRRYRYRQFVRTNHVKTYLY